MEEAILPYLPFLIGCQCTAQIEFDQWETLKGTIKGFTYQTSDDLMEKGPHVFVLPKDANGTDWPETAVQMVKPHHCHVLLRHINLMTEEELKVVLCKYNRTAKFRSARWDSYKKQWCIEAEDGINGVHSLWFGVDTLLLAEDLRWLLQQGIDMFGLIEKGLAINQPLATNHVGS